MANDSEIDDRKLIVERYLKGREKVLDQIDPWEDPNYELYLVTDRYGFIHKNHLPEKLTQFENKVRQLEATRSNKWVKMLTNWNSPETREKLRERVFKGIPNNVRGKVWCLLLGVSRVREEQKGRYQEMLNWALLNSSDVRQIDLDVNRTFRNNDMFKERYNIKQQELFKILVAYSVYNSEIGYCQGMSQIAALLLMYLHDEEDAFWALDRLMTDERYAMHGFFIPGFPKLQRFARHHDKVLKKFLPKVYKHFKKFDIDSTLYTLKWFFQCFLDRVPFSLTLRLWDCFMLEGEVILTSMSYTLLKLHKRTVIKKGMEDLIEFLQVDLEKDFGYHDDEAITALQQSIGELRRHKMDSPTDAPSDLERPTKPFGYLLQADNASLSAGYDDQSVVGSIILNQDSASLAGNSSRASSMDYDQESGGKVIVRKEKEISGKEKEISGKEKEIPGKAKEISGKAKEIPGKAKEIPGKAKEIPGKAKEISGKEEEKSSSNPPTVLGENNVDQQGQTVTNVEVNGCSESTVFGTGNGQVSGSTAFGTGNGQMSESTAFGTGNGQVRSGGRSESPERFCVREVSLPRLNAVEAIVSRSSIVYASNDSTQVVTVTSPASPPLSLHSNKSPVPVNHNSDSPASNNTELNNTESNNTESNSNRYIISNSNNEKVRIYVPFSCVEAVVSSERHLNSSNASILPASTTNSNSSSSFCNHSRENENRNHSRENENRNHSRENENRNHSRENESRNHSRENENSNYISTVTSCSGLPPVDT